MEAISHFDAFMILLASTPIWLLALHAVAGRILRFIVPGVQPQLTVVICVVIGYLPLGGVLWRLYTGGLADRPLEAGLSVFYAFIVYTALAYSYFHLFNMSETARRIKILALLNRYGASGPDRLGSGYGAGEMLEARLERLRSTGQIREADGRYMLDGKALCLAAGAVAVWAWVLGMPFDVGGISPEVRRKRN